MVDVTARRTAAALLRDFADGRITNDQFQEGWPSSNDPALRELFDTAWHLYSDVREYRLAGADTLPVGLKSDVARWVRFLESDLEYEWPVMSLWKRWALAVSSIATLGFVAWVMRRRFAQSPAAAAWPFKADDDQDQIRLHRR